MHLKLTKMRIQGSVATMRKGKGTFHNKVIIETPYQIINYNRQDWQLRASFNLRFNSHLAANRLER